ncbi:hypothetical protein [Mesobacillus maritimus]|uniref:Inner spore coat protein n=1 Tax=Mesobacillus maritimus TaxID=1643336 RepID=A0ABS7K975_9BACI|nr:hypothetical protein [Mesobacillus maritimus]MBY0098824.1 hypothetical protein [Mesobacillus maritimus]
MYDNRYYCQYQNPYPHQYFYQSFPTPYIYRQYPEVDDTIFHKSVMAFQTITKESSTILQKLSDRSFAHKLMTAAQKGNQHEVDGLMKSIGINTPITTKYTPSGLELRIHADVEGSQCCTLTMFLKWGN